MRGVASAPLGVVEIQESVISLGVLVWTTLAWLSHSPRVSLLETPRGDPTLEGLSQSSRVAPVAASLSTSVGSFSDTATQKVTSQT